MSAIQVSGGGVMSGHHSVEKTMPAGDDIFLDDAVLFCARAARVLDYLQHVASDWCARHTDVGRKTLCRAGRQRVGYTSRRGRRVTAGVDRRPDPRCE